MTFLRTFDTLLAKSNNSICKIISEDGLTLYNYNSTNNLLSSKQIMKGDFSFLDYWFDIDNNDKVYGLINNKKDSLIYMYLTSKCIVKNTILKYDSNLNSVKFVFIKKMDKDICIFYYLIENNNPYNCKLIHHYKKDGTWSTYTVDSISYEVLTNFVVIYDKNIINIFYLKLINGIEELFVSSFNYETSNWSDPIQVTSTQKHKIYLSVIKDFNSCYHIIFSENNSNKYYCTYINGYINDSNFSSSNYGVLTNTVACTFPTVIQYNNTLYANWIEFHNLYYCYSKNFGKTWSKSEMDKLSNNTPFICCNYHSNSIYDKKLNSFTFFRDKNSTTILGIN